MRYAPDSAVLLLTLLAAPAAAQQSAFNYAPAVAQPEVDAIRASTMKYTDIKIALSEGYMLPAEHCMVANDEGQPRQLGAMGLHFIRPDLLKPTQTAPRVDGVGTHADFNQPGVLIYEPQADGSMELVAIENLVWVKAWEAAGNTAPPSYNGYDYYLMIDNPATPNVDEAHGFEPHYELHWWMYRENPNGQFAPFNPAVTCENYKPTSHAH